MHDDRILWLQRELERVGEDDFDLDDLCSREESDWLLANIPKVREVENEEDMSLADYLDMSYVRTHQAVLGGGGYRVWANFVENQEWPNPYQWQLLRDAGDFDEAITQLIEDRRR